MDKSIGYTLRKYRKKAGYTLCMVERLLGMSTAQVSRIERGLIHGGVKLDELQSLCSLYHITITQLLEEVEWMYEVSSNQNTQINYLILQFIKDYALIKGYNDITRKVRYQDIASVEMILSMILEKYEKENKELL